MLRDEAEICPQGFCRFSGSNYNFPGHEIYDTGKPQIQHDADTGKSHLVDDISDVDVGFEAENCVSGEVCAEPEERFSSHFLHGGETRGTYQRASGGNDSLHTQQCCAPGLGEENWNRTPPIAERFDLTTPDTSELGESDDRAHPEHSEAGVGLGRNTNSLNAAGNIRRKLMSKSECGCLDLPLNTSF